MAALAIILSILKIVGIVVLVILAIIILLLFLILFMPIRYRAYGRIDENNNDFKMKACWLFGLLTFEGYPDDGGFSYAIKLFGHKIYPKKGV